MKVMRVMNYWRNNSMRQRQRRPDAGMALIMTLWIVLAIAALVLVFSRAVRVDMIAAANQNAALQADAVARGALQYVMAKVDGRKGVPPTDTDAPCQAVAIGDGLFWILRPPQNDETSYSYGIVDESRKININTAATDMLLKLPNMTSDVAAAISDWRNPDSAVADEGAESDYYLLLDPPYYCKNSPFETVEELRLVRGVTAPFLYGQDANRNSVIEAAEEISETGAPTFTTSATAFGIYNMVTVYGAEPNTNASGARRVNVNSASNGAIAGVLRRAMSGARLTAVQALARQNRPFRNIIDFSFSVNLTPAEFAAIADLITTRNAQTSTGLLNVNTASRDALLCLPGLEVADADALIAKRSASGVDLTNIAWVAAAIARAKAIAIGDLITTKSYFYSADIVAVSGDGRAYKRYRAVLDARQSPPQVVYWKDITHLGWPLAPDILATLRHGADADKAALKESL
jgi:type II secretory pathway component PulK